MRNGSARIGEGKEGLLLLQFELLFIKGAYDI